MKQPPSTPNAVERRSTFVVTTVANNSCLLPPVPSRRASLGAAVDKNCKVVGNPGELQKMKNQTNTQLVVCSSLALILALALCSPIQAQSAQTAEEKTPTAAAMMERCQEMKEQKQKLKEDMKAQDAQLTEQLANMNRAPEDKQMGLMAGVLTHMVQQRIAMDARKAKMEDEMMQHMQMGKESMSQCPMMKSMKDMDENPVGANKEPQE